MNEYRQLQKQVVDMLRGLGIWFKYEDRLALFFLIHNIKVLKGEGEEINKLIDVLSTMVKLRTEGKEPPHKNGEYERAKDPGSGAASAE